MSRRASRKASILALLALALSAQALAAAPVAAEKTSKTGTECVPWEGQSEGYWNGEMVCAGSPPGEAAGGMVVEVKSTVPCRFCNLPDDRSGSLGGRALDAVIDVVFPRGFGLGQFWKFPKEKGKAVVIPDDYERKECTRILEDLERLKGVIKANREELARFGRSRGAWRVRRLEELRKEVRTAELLLPDALREWNTKWTHHASSTKDPGRLVSTEMSCERLLKKKFIP